MKCPNCKAEIAATAAFCENCGTDIPQASTAKRKLCSLCSQAFSAAELKESGGQSLCPNCYGQSRMIRRQPEAKAASAPSAARRTGMTQQIPVMKDIVRSSEAPEVEEFLPDPTWASIFDFVKGALLITLAITAAMIYEKRPGESDWQLIMLIPVLSWIGCFIALTVAYPLRQRNFVTWLIATVVMGGGPLLLELFGWLAYVCGRVVSGKRGLAFLPLAVLLAAGNGAAYSYSKSLKASAAPNAAAESAEQITREQLKRIALHATTALRTANEDKDLFPKNKEELRQSVIRTGRASIAGEKEWEKLFTDGWGNPIAYNFENRHYEVISNGPDKKPNTEDDITISGGLEGANISEPAKAAASIKEETSKEAGPEPKEVSEETQPPQENALEQKSEPHEKTAADAAE